MPRCVSQLLRHVKHIITVYTYTTGHILSSKIPEIPLKACGKLIWKSPTFHTLDFFFFPVQFKPVCYCTVIFFSFLSPTIVYRTSSILPFLSLRWKSPLVKHVDSMNSLMNNLKGFFPQPTLVFPSLFRKHTLTHTHSGVSSPCPQSPTLCQQTCRDHDVIISPIARLYAFECVAVYRKILSGGFHRTCELTTVSTLVHVCIIGIKMSGFLILLFVAKQTAILIHFWGE